MKREFLKTLGIDDKEVIDKIMDAAGKDVNATKQELENTKKELETANNTIKEINGQLDGLKEVNPDNLKAQIESLKAANLEIQEKNKKELEELRKRNAIKLALSGKVFDEEITESLIDKDKIVFDGENAVGLDEQIKKLRTEKAFLFKNNVIKTDYKPAAGNISADNNPWVTGNLTKQAEIYRENPTQAKELAAAAGQEI